jgi:PPM family protein phosphatase
MRVRFSARTHVGQRREVNQDAYNGGTRGPATLLVVCDGMGGHAAGEVASQLAVETIMEVYDPVSAPGPALRQAFVTANQRVYSQGHGSMGTTGVAALFLHDRLYVANVGDSRAYLVREGQITQISLDHSFVSDQVAAGLMTADQARQSNIRNIITRAIGHSAEVEVDLFDRELCAGDTVLLSSDGMHGLILDEEIAEISGMFTPDEAAQRLVDLANERGGIDNITVMIAQVDELDAPDARATLAIEPAPAPPPAPTPEPPLSRLGLALASLTLLLLISLGALVAYTPSATPNSLPVRPTPTAPPTPALTPTP